MKIFYAQKQRVILDIRQTQTAIIGENMKKYGKDKYGGRHLEHVNVIGNNGFRVLINSN